jgi:triphosphoribosyl-dephospho-CoA synthase
MSLHAASLESSLPHAQAGVPAPRSANTYAHEHEHERTGTRTAARPLASSLNATTAARDYASELARQAVRALYAELVAYPKPGLVSRVDNGSHDDMDASTFMRSLFSLRHYFRLICLAGAQGAPFARLKQLGIEAEARMMRATRGINTHRGAIFSLGLLCAAAGRQHAQGRTLTAAALRAALLDNWGPALAGHASAIAPSPLTPNFSQAAPDANACRDASHLSHGLQAAALHAASGAREEGALGLPSVFEVGLPALQAALARGASIGHARVDTLFALMAHISDSNVYYRAGPQGAQIVHNEARRFLAQGGTQHPEWFAKAEECHRLFVHHRLSPGGAADLLAASCLLHAMLDAPKATVATPAASV